MFFVAIAGVLAVPKVLELTNRVLEEYVIPRLSLKKAAEGEMQLYQQSFEVALTPQEMGHLHEIGALDVLKNGVHRQHHIAEAEARRLKESNDRPNE